MWLGLPVPRGSMWYEFPTSELEDIEGRDPTCFRLENGKPQARRPSCWFTNIQHGRRHTPMKLMTMAGNVRFDPKKVQQQGYPTYDNYDAIEVAEKKATPSGYAGVMGVPITFLEVYCPEQFEILGCSYNYGRPDCWDPETKMGTEINGVARYKRLFIRHLTPEKKDS